MLFLQSIITNTGNTIKSYYYDISSANIDNWEFELYDEESGETSKLTGVDIDNIVAIGVHKVKDDNFKRFLCCWSSLDRELIHSLKFDILSKLPETGLFRMQFNSIGIKMSNCARVVEVEGLPNGFYYQIDDTQKRRWYNIADMLNVIFGNTEGDCLVLDCICTKDSLIIPAHSRDGISLVCYSIPKRFFNKFMSMKLRNEKLLRW